MAVLTPKVYKLYVKLRKRYPFELHKTDNPILSNIRFVYPDFWDDYSVCKKECNKIHSRRKRVRNYIRRMIEFRGYHIPCLVSLTFTDDCLNSTSFSTRKSYVRDYLNEVFPDWFACVDYGKKNGREHYHAIALFPCNVRYFTFIKKRKSFMLPVCPRFDWSHGFYSIRPLEVDPQDIYKTLNYAFKSSSYAFKSSCDSVKPFHKRGFYYDDLDCLFRKE